VLGWLVRVDDDGEISYSALRPKRDVGRCEAVASGVPLSEELGRTRSATVLVWSGRPSTGCRTPVTAAGPWDSSEDRVKRLPGLLGKVSDRSGSLDWFDRGSESGKLEGLPRRALLWGLMVGVRFLRTQQRVKSQCLFFAAPVCWGPFVLV
jgi:hypothetical protein